MELMNRIKLNTDNHLRGEEEGCGTCQAELEYCANAAAHAGLGSHHFRLQRLPGDETELPRQDCEMRLPHFDHDFRTVFSIKAKRAAHINLLEARS